MKFEDVIKKRASIRKYSTKAVKPELIIEAIESANLAPSPGNLQILKYIIVEDDEVKKKIVEHCRQEFIKDAQFVVVVCSDSKDAKRFYDDKADVYVKHHVGAAVENFLLKITDMGLACCWVGAFSDGLKSVLRVPDNINIEVILPVSYPAVDSLEKQKRKLKIYGRVFYNSFKNTFKVGKEMVRREDI